MDKLDEFLKSISGLIDERIKQQEPPIYEIDLSKKYILIIESEIPPAAFERIRAAYSHWVKSDEPILILTGAKVRLVKVETDE